MIKWLRKQKKSGGLDSNDLFDISNDVTLRHTKGFTINGVKWELHSEELIAKDLAHQILSGVLSGKGWHLDWKLEGEY